MRALTSLCLLLSSSYGFAQTPDRYEGLDLDDLLAPPPPPKAKVASIKPLTFRDAPGIITAITREEMLAYGARDLIDVLMMVPGFFFAVDVQGVVGVGLRGNWAQEGKLLLIVDGIEMNGLDYQTLNFGHHYPVETLERVEIIRGPGSAVYGGTAMLGVVRVTTRGAREVDGARVAVRYGTPSRLFSGGDQAGFFDATVEAGTTHGAFAWSASAMVGRSVRSDAPYVSLGDERFEMGSDSELRPAFVNLGLSYGATQLRFIWDGFGYSSKDAFGEPSELTHRYRFGGVYAELSSAFDLAEGLTLMPRLSYRRQQEYWTDFDDEETLQDLLDEELFLHHHASRALAGLSLSWDLFAGANLIFGVEAFIDRGERVRAEDITSDPELQELVAGENDYFDAEGESIGALQFFTTSIFAQFLWLNEILNVTAGGRVEIHDRFGVFAVPRLALTKVFGPVHMKLLAAQAFRTPSIQNASLERVVFPDNVVRREQTTVLEAEVGYEPVEGLIATVNGFYTQIDDPLVYTFEEGVGETYVNGDQVFTAGVEAQLSWVLPEGLAVLNYAYYHVIGETLEDFAVPDPASRLAAPRHKLTARLTYDIVPRLLRVTPSVVWLGERWGFAAGAGDEPVRLDDQWLLGLAVTSEDLGLPGFGVGLFAHNLLDQVQTFPQAYAGGHAVLPGPGRQIMLRLSYGYDR